MSHVRGVAKLEVQSTTGVAMGAFGRGFMGCLGVLAAIVAVVVVLIVWGGVSGDRKASRIAAGTAEAADYLTFCAEAWPDVERQYVGAVGGEPSVAEPTIINRGPPTVVACAATHPRGTIVYAVQMNCSAQLSNCTRVNSAYWEDGQRLRRR